MAINTTLSRTLITSGTILAVVGLLLVFGGGAIRHRPQDVPAIVALVIAAGYWWTSSTSFANPAITIARAMSDTFAGIRPTDAPGFIAAQIGGAVLAWVAGDWLFGRKSA